MQISQKLPQFEKKSLIITAGRRAADIYFAFQGKIEKIDSIKVETPKYSDKEGFFVRMGKGRVWGRGSVLEDQNEETDRKFLKELKEKTEEHTIKDEIENIYLFAASHVKKGLPEHLANNIRQRISFVIEGNYIKKHPFDLIKKIKDKQEGKKPKFISEAAMKILRRK